MHLIRMLIRGFDHRCRFRERRVDVARVDEQRVGGRLHPDLLIHVSLR
jgi:hypothetical protein